jgi:Zn-dependent alcohol dehydrogenases, class III
MGAIAIDARSADPVEQIKEATVERGVDVALELIGSAKTMRQAGLCLALSDARPCRINRRIDVDSSVH